MHLPDLPDDKLLQLMQSGNQAAFATVYNRYWTELYQGAGKRLGNPSIAQDIVQDIMEKIWIKKHELTTSNGSLRPYLFTLLKYRIIDTLANTRRQDICYHAFGQLLTMQEHNALEGLISKELQAAIDHTIASMPVNMQKVIVLSRQQNHSVADIAHLLSLSEQTVRNLLSQAVKRLKICVNQFYNDSPAASLHATFMAVTITLLRL